MMDQPRQSVSAERTAAVVCPGPSSEMFVTAGQDYDVVIGVNRVVLWYPVDYWSCADLHTFRWVIEQGGPAGDPPCRPKIVCKRAIHQAIRNKFWGELEKFPFYPVGEIVFNDTNLRWAKFSAHVSIALAVHLGCRKIDCYGMDWSGTADADGFTDGRQIRTPERWGHERKRFEALVDVLEKRNVELSRVGCG